MLPCIIMSDTQASTEIVKLPAGKQPAVRVMPMPSDANVHGDVFGVCPAVAAEIQNSALPGGPKPATSVCPVTAAGNSSTLARPMAPSACS